MTDEEFVRAARTVRAFGLSQRQTLIEFLAEQAREEAKTQVSVALLRQSVRSATR